MKVVVVGMGYVGIPVALKFAEVGFDTVGVEVNKSRVNLLNKGIYPIEGKEPQIRELLTKVMKTGRFKASNDFSHCREADAVFICVQTPFNKKKFAPDYSALSSAVKEIATNLKRGALVVVESTIAPGTMGKVVKPILEKEGMKAGSDFYLAHCPERVMPGKLLYNLENMNRIVGGINEASTKRAIEFYKKTVKGTLYPTDMTTAEIVKTTENAYRDTQIAFANEVAIICEKLGSDFYKVRELVNTSPGRNMLFAGAGVGGHCIPKDPLLLASSVKGKFNPNVIISSRKINDMMPNHVVEIIGAQLKLAGKTLRSAKITLLGASYLPNSDDMRNSPSVTVFGVLKKKGAKPVVFDPYVKEAKGLVLVDNMVNALNGSDCIVLLTAHDAFEELKSADKLREIKQKMKTPIIVDGRGFFDRAVCEKTGFSFAGIGRGRQSINERLL